MKHADTDSYQPDHYKSYLTVDRPPPPRTGHHIHDRIKRNEEVAREEEARGERRLIQETTFNGYKYTAWALTKPNEMNSRYEILVDSGFINYCRRCENDDDVLATLERMLKAHRRNARV